MRSTAVLLVLFIHFLSSEAQFVPTNGPKVPGTVEYVWGRNDTGFVTHEESLWRTFDGGVTWKVMANGLPNEVDPRCMAEANGTMYIGTNSGARVYSSSNWGDTWTTETDGSSVLWVPTHLTDNGKSVLIGGTLFEPHYYDIDQKKWISSGLSGTTHALRYLDDTTVIANVGSVSKGYTHVSYDGGKSWTQFATEPSVSTLNITGVTFDYIKMGNRIVCTPTMNGYNPQYTDDNGTSWIEGTGAKMSGLYYYGRKLNKRDDGMLLLNKTGVLYISSDSGTTWTNGNQYLGVDFTMWKLGSILCSSGMIDGNTRMQIGFVSSVNNLVQFNQKLFTQTKEFSCSYDGTTWSTDTMKNETRTFGFGTINKIEIVDDSLYLCTSSGLFGSGNGVDFVSVKKEAISFSNIGCYSRIGNTYLIGTVSNRGNQEPKIYYSTDSKTWTQATFTNKIGFGTGGVANRIDHIFEHKGKLIADLHGGYAISSDDGVTWTWVGSSLYGNVVSDGSVLVRMTDDFLGLKPRLLQLSTDNGDNWKTIFDGMPDFTGQSNFNSFWNIYNVKGRIYVEAFGGGERKLMLLDVANEKWVGTAQNTTLPESGALTDLQEVDGVLYAAIENDGVYKADGSAGFVRLSHTPVKLFPNPTNGAIWVDSEKEYLNYQVYNLHGCLLMSGDLTAGQKIDLVHFKSGIYVVRLEGVQGVSSVKVIRR